MNFVVGNTLQHKTRVILWGGDLPPLPWRPTCVSARAAAEHGTRLDPLRLNESVSRDSKKRIIKNVQQGLKEFTFEAKSDIAQSALLTFVPAPP